MEARRQLSAVSSLLPWALGIKCRLSGARGKHSLSHLAGPHVVLGGWEPVMGRSRGREGTLETSSCLWETPSPVVVDGGLVDLANAAQGQRGHFSGTIFFFSPTIGVPGPCFLAGYHKHIFSQAWGMCTHMCVGTRVQVHVHVYGHISKHKAIPEDPASFLRLVETPWPCFPG